MRLKFANLCPVVVIGTAIFENGVSFSFPVEWDHLTDSYSFTFNEIPYSFTVKRDLTELGEVIVCETVDVICLTEPDPAFKD